MWDTCGFGQFFETRIDSYLHHFHGFEKLRRVARLILFVDHVRKLVFIFPQENAANHVIAMVFGSRHRDLELASA